MKANPQPRARSSAKGAFPLLVLAGISTAILSGCVPPPPSTPAPARHHGQNHGRAQTPPAARPATPAAPPPMQRPASSDWRDVPASPGDWAYSTYAGGSMARFGGQFAIRCDLRTRTVMVERAMTPHAGAGAMAVTSSTGARSLPLSATTTGMQAALTARDPLLDAMAFSRGRFAVAVTGEPTLYVPSWTEISRVIEDCR